MRKIKKLFDCILSNGCIALGLAVVVFKILDWYNPYMNFMGYSEIVLYLLCGFAMLSGMVRLSEKGGD